jgi:hypothetical protein
MSVRSRESTYDSTRPMDVSICPSTLCAKGTVPNPGTTEETETPTTTEGRRPCSRRVHSEEEILDGALQDEGGPNAASMRRIAAKGASAPTPPTPTSSPDGLTVAVPS